MDKELFVKNVKKYCDLKGVNQTTAFIESGVGKSFFTNINNRNSDPAVSKVANLAKYLGVTTSDLLGEIIPASDEPGGLSEEMIEIIELYDKASPEVQAAALAMLRAAEAARSTPDDGKGGQ